MNKITFIVNIIGITGLLGVACTDDQTNYLLGSQEKYPLNSFIVQVGASQYHGKIDQKSGKVEIGAIENGNSITGVSYELWDKESAISPEPQTFLQNWQKEQTVTVTTSNGMSKTYTITFTKLNVGVPDYLFVDDFEVDGNPDDTKWVLCPKASSDWNDEMSESYDQAYVEDGKLILKAEKNNDEYLAGGIKTEGKFGFTFGKVEVRARITQYPNGAFPAIWMMPKKYIYSGWPDCGEIDIMEHIKQEPNIHQTLHTHYRNTLGYQTGTTKTTVCDYTDWNIYGLEWTSERLTFFVNGQETFTYTNMHLSDEAEKKQWPFTEDSEFYIILNMGLGDEGTWAGPVDDDNLPAIMEVDWVRVSKLEE